jgi:hypothetical protein
MTKKNAKEEALRAIADINLHEMDFDDVVVMRLTIKISVALARRALGRDLDDVEMASHGYLHSA